MKFDLMCKENMKGIIEELLKSKGAEIHEESKYRLLDKGIGEKLEINFNFENLDVLLEFIEEINGVVKKTKKSIVGKKEDKFEVLKNSEIIYFEAEGNNVYSKTTKGIYKIKEKLFEIEERLGEEGFIRINKSCVVNVVNVKEIIPWFNSKLLLKFEGSDTEQEVSRTYIKKFKTFLEF